MTARPATIDETSDPGAWADAISWLAPFLTEQPSASLCRRIQDFGIDRETAKSLLANRYVVEERGHASPCWIWTGAKNRRGYGRMHIAGYFWQPHRVAYEIHHGDMPRDRAIDHLCRVTSCINPEHLEAVTTAENNRRKLHDNGLLTHCGRGHERTPENTHIRPCGRRTCRDCKRVWNRTQREAKRALCVANDGERPNVAPVDFAPFHAATVSQPEKPDHV